MQHFGVREHMSWSASTVFKCERIMQSSCQHRNPIELLTLSLTPVSSVCTSAAPCVGDGDDSGGGNGGGGYDDTLLCRNVKQQSSGQRASQSQLGSSAMPPRRLALA
jgi:hypothetical protein